MTRVLTLPKTRVEAEAGETILGAILRCGWSSPYRCRGGACGGCQIRIVHGRVDHGPHTVRALPAERRRTGVALACRAVPVSDVTIEPLDGQLRSSTPWLHDLNPARSDATRREATA